MLTAPLSRSGSLEVSMSCAQRILYIAIACLCSSAGSAPAFGQELHAVSDRLEPSNALLAGGSLASADGRYRLVYQTDGNLVLYDGATGLALWWSGTVGEDPGQAVMQDDGDFVVYDADGTPVWWAGTAGYPSAHLVLQDDANLVVYAPGDVPAWWSAGSNRDVVVLTGQVVDAATGEPVAGAIVSINRGSPTISDAFGRYSAIGSPDARGFNFASVWAENYVGNDRYIDATFATLYLLPIECLPADEPAPLPD